MTSQITRNMIPYDMTCAIRIARGQENKHNSMHHISHKLILSNQIKKFDRIAFLIDIKQEIKGWQRYTLEEFKI